MKPRRTMVTVSKPRCGCCGKPGTTSPWYMRQPSLPSKSCRCRGRRATPRDPALVARRIGVVVVDAEQEGIERLPRKPQREYAHDDGLVHLDLGKLDLYPGL